MMKYDREARKKALDYYFDNDESISGACRKLGYPSRELLRKWIAEDRRFVPGLIKPGRRKGSGKKELNVRTRYPYEFKVAAVETALSSGMPYAQVARAMGMTCYATIYNWIGKFKEGGYAALKGNRGKGAPPAAGPADVDEIVADLPDDPAELKRIIARQRLELDVERATVEALKKDLGLSADDMAGIAVEVVASLRPEHAVREVLACMGVPRATYYYRLRRAAAGDKYAEMRGAIREIFAENGEEYGYRRIWMVLKSRGVTLSQRVIARIMREEGLRPVTTKRESPYRSFKGEPESPIPNLLGRDFSADAPNQKWATDITQVVVGGEKVYVSPVIDLFNGEVVACTWGRRPDMKLVMDMLWRAVERLGNGDVPILHSDMGSQYTSPSWIRELDRLCIIQSMSRKGNCLDNACAESFFARLKLGMFHHREHKTADEFCESLSDWIRWYNEDRIRLSTGMSPVAFRERWEEANAA